MKISNTLYAASREDWREWLEKNHDTEKDVWLIYYKKHTGRARIPYDDAVEEAICFGWIDSTVKKIDEEKYVQKFSPRKAGSKWSELNIKRARKMIKEGMMTETGLLKFKERNEYDRDLSEALRSNVELPPDLEKALNENKKARDNFNNFAPSYRKQYILWVTGAKKEETRQRRIERIVKLAEQNKKQGMM